LEEVATILPLPLRGATRTTAASSSIMLRAKAHHVHPVEATVVLMSSRRTGGRALHRRLPAVRHTRRAVATQHVWVLQSQLTNYFCPQRKLTSQGARWREGDQEIRQSNRPASPRPRSREGQNRGPSNPRRHPCEHQRRTPTPNLGTVHWADHLRNRQDDTARENRRHAGNS